MFGFGKKSGPEQPPLPPEEPDFRELIACGAYRAFEPAEVEPATRLAQEAFPEFAQRITCFGCDWLGRMFATDRQRSGEVLMLEPGTGEVLEIPVTADDFHEQELVFNADAAIAFSFYRDWLGNGGERPQAGQCIGYRQPLFLGGHDGVENLECTDLEVYWSITAQLLAKIRGKE